MKTTEAMEKPRTHDWEIIRILDFAVAGDTEGVKRYARRLADKYCDVYREPDFAMCILSAIGDVKVPMATMDKYEEKYKDET